MSQARYECATCYDVLSLPAAAAIQGEKLCQTCFDAGIRPLFERHLIDESAPPKWQRHEISILEVEHQFDEEFVVRYQVQKLGYDILPKYRIYCAAKPKGVSCGMHIGDTRYDVGFGRIACPCGSLICVKCKNIIESGPGEHICAKKTSDEPDGLEGQTRGVDYQLCPECNVAVHLRDGCNHMTCELPACHGTEFCYICGEKANLTDGHWEAGRLYPRYGLPGRIEEIERDYSTDIALLGRAPSITRIYDLLIDVRRDVIRRGEASAGDVADHPEVVFALRFYQDSVRIGTRALEQLPRAIAQHPSVLKKRAAMAPAIRAAFKSGISQNDVAALRRFPAIAEAERAVQDAVRRLPKEPLLEVIIADLRRQSSSASAVLTWLALHE